MTRPTIIGAPFLYLTGQFGGDVTAPPGSESPPDCCDIGETPPDRAGEDSAQAVILSEPGSPALVQSKSNFEGLSASVTVTLDAAPTAGNLLVAWHSVRSGIAPLTPDGWTAHPSGTVDAGVDKAGMFYKVSDGTETAITMGLSTGTQHALTIAEFSGIGNLDTSNETTGSGTALTTGSVTPTASAEVLIVGGAAVNTGDAMHSVTPAASYLEIEDAMADDGVTGGFHPLHWMAYRLVASASGSYDPAGTASSGGDFGGQTLVFLSGADPAWNVLAPAAVDDDDATYVTIETADLLRVDLGAAFPIAQTRIRIATETAGSRTLTIKAANVVDFSDEVTVTTIAFTATGSHTAQDVSAVWIPDGSYRHWELSIDVAEENRVHTWELREATPGSNVVTDPTNGDAPAVLQDVLDNLDGALDDHLTDTTDAHDASAVSIVDAGGYYTGTTVEAALQEAGPSLTGRWEVVVSGTAPPVAVTTEAEDDWLYALVT